MKVPQNKYQFPFLSKTLIRSGAFIRLCRENGINIYNSDLSLLWEKKLLIPSIKCFLKGFPIRRIYIETNGKMGWLYINPDNLHKSLYEKLDPKTYYQHGSIYLGSEKKGGPYRKGRSKMNYSFPSQDKENQEFKLENINYDTLESPEIFEDNYEVFFDETQIFLLKIILKTFGGVHGNLLKDRINNDKLVKSVQKELFEHHKYLCVFQEWKSLLLELKETSEENKKLSLNAFPDDKNEAEIEFKALCKRSNQNILPKLKNSLKKNKITINDFKKWEDFVVEYNFFNQHSHRFPFIKKYIKDIKESSFFAGEYINKMISYINWGIEIIENKPRISITESLQISAEMHDHKYKFCETCQVTFIPKRKNQITCGQETCIEMHKKRLKRSRSYYKPKKKN